MALFPLGGNIVLTALYSSFLFPIDYKIRFPDCSDELAFQWEQKMPENGRREKDGYCAEKGDGRFSLNKKEDFYDFEKPPPKRPLLEKIRWIGAA